MKLIYGWHTDSCTMWNAKIALQWCSFVQLNKYNAWNQCVCACVRASVCECVVDLFLLYDGVGFNEAFRQLLHKTNIYTWTHTHRHTLNKRNSKKIAKGVTIVCYWFTRWKFVGCLFFFFFVFLFFESVFITWCYLSFQFDSVSNQI